VEEMEEGLRAKEGSGNGRGGMKEEDFHLALPMYCEF